MTTETLPTTIHDVVELMCGHIAELRDDAALSLQFSKETQRGAAGHMEWARQQSAVADALAHYAHLFTRLTDEG
jgi:hypothetical protein|tara:strand:+ start:201 stop:422 length:222 start_codon:yes stop_codon:yes gene_type:complete